MSLLSFAKLITSRMIYYLSSFGTDVSCQIGSGVEKMEEVCDNTSILEAVYMRNPDLGQL